jgi:DNA-binding NarL/FixJ family response regulator
MSQIRVLLADDHTLVRAGLRSLLAATAGVEVVGEASNGVEAERLVIELRPDVALMDVSMPELNGIEATRRLTKLQPRPRILVVSMHSNPEYVRQALIAGAQGYVLKDAEPHELRMALSAVARGEAWISPAIAQSVVDDVVRSKGSGPCEALTPRQREVLQLVAEGQSTQRIARRLRLSVKTVETHRAQIMQRLDIHHVAGLVRYALRKGIIPPDE